MVKNIVKDKLKIGFFFFFDVTISPVHFCNRPIVTIVTAVLIIMCVQLNIKIGINIECSLFLFTLKFYFITK